MNIIKWLKIYVLACWSILIFQLLSMPMRPSSHPQFTFADKAVHIVLFFVLTFLIIYAWEERLNPKQFLRLSVAASVFALAYSIFFEFYQMGVPGRDADVNDVLAGVIGIGGAFYSGYLFFRLGRPKLLLHICCIGCGVYVSQILQEKYNVILYFYNPNIFPREEYDRRLEEIKKVSKKFGFPIFIGNYDYETWKQGIKGYEQEPEKGERCMICYRERLFEAARFAASKNIPYLTSTLTTSPHKDAQAIMRIGQEAAKKYGVEFLPIDFKKNDGFKKSSKMSRDLGLYRQNYCGCEFSIKSN